MRISSGIVGRLGCGRERQRDQQRRRVVQKRQAPALRVGRGRLRLKNGDLLPQGREFQAESVRLRRKTRPAAAKEWMSSIRSSPFQYVVTSFDVGSGNAPNS
jgi:hypothetical protein